MRPGPAGTDTQFFFGLWQRIELFFKKYLIDVLPREVGRPWARVAWTTSKMPKITISGIDVLAFLELRDRV